MINYQQNRGFSFIELIIFIVIIGVVVAGMMVPLNAANQKSPTDFYLTQATQLAQERMELILGQKRLQGFDNLNDPCDSSTPPPDCSFSGYVIASQLSDTNINGDPAYKTIVVTVTGLAQVSLTALVGKN